MPNVVRVTPNLSVTVLHALSDNFMYLIIDEVSKQAAVVDPADPGVALQAAADAGARLAYVLTTHHHFDHAGGNNDIKRAVSGIAVVGGDDVKGMTRKVGDGETLTLGSCVVQHRRMPQRPPELDGVMLVRDLTADMDEQAVRASLAVHSLQGVEADTAGHGTG